MGDYNCSIARSRVVRLGLELEGVASLVPQADGAPSLRRDFSLKLAALLVPHA